MRTPTLVLALQASLLGALAPAVLRGQAIGEPWTEPGAGGAVPSHECCLELLLPVGARGTALGRALSALPSPEAVFGNPAGIAGLDGGALIIHHGRSVAGQIYAVSGLFTLRSVGTLGLSYELVDLGEIEGTDELGNPTGTIAIQDHLLVASFATHLAPGLAGGINYKIYHQQGGSVISATTQAVDAGIQYRPGWLPWVSLGAGVTNVGFALQVKNAEQRDPLPSRIRVGVAYEVLRHVLPDSAFSLWVAMEVGGRLRDLRAPRASVGVELAARDAVFVRAGYAGGEGLESGAAVGFGLRHRRYDLAIARSFVRSPIDPDLDPLEISFGMSF